MMKFSTAAASAVLLASSASLTVTNAFVGPSSASSLARPRQRQSRLGLLPVVEPNAALESASVLTSVVDGSGVVDTLGSLALLGSVGFGVFMGKSNNKDWSYEYKPGNDAFSGSGGAGESSDLALLEESPTSVMEKVEEETTKPSVTPAQETFFGSDGGAAAAAASSPASEATTASPAQKTFFGKTGTTTAGGPSKELLESTEKAKAQVQKVGVQETKDKMSSKTGGASPGPVEPTPAKASSSSEVEGSTAKPGGKRRVAKGFALIVAAGVVAAARNVVKAYLGRGML